MPGIKCQVIYSPSGRTVIYQWGGTGCGSCGSGGDVQLTKITDPGNNIWEFKYDIMGNAIEMIYPDGSTIKQGFDMAGRLKNFTNKRNQSIHYSYDTDGRMVKKSLPEGDVLFTYDDKDRVTSIQASDYHYSYQYGSAGGSYGNSLVHVEDLKSGLWSQHVYNRYGLPIEYYDSFQWKKSYTYNFTQSGGTHIGFTPYIVSYHKFYSQSGQYKTVYTYYKALRLYRKRNDYLKTERRFFYDSNGILSQMNHRNVSGYSGFPETNLYLNRDDSGIITSITGDKELNAFYNPDLEIISVYHTLPTIFDESYTYDTRGNRLSSLTGNYTYNDLNQLEVSSTHTYQYDADGNLVEEKDPVTGEKRKYYYDSENRLTGYEHYPALTSPADITATYKYDIYGRRLQKNVNGVVTNFFWEDDNLAYELDAAYQPIRRYVYGAGKDDVEGYVEFSEVDGFVFDSSKKGWYTYIKDQVGTVYKVYSDYSKQIVDTRTYDTFGNIIHRVGSSNGNLGFQSKYFDQESGMYYFYHRYYNPVNGRFLNEDPIGLDGGLNMYAFVNNNPLKWIDPYGLNPFESHPERLRLACLLFKKADFGISQNEYGAWFYADGTVDRMEDWWQPSGTGAARPRPPQKIVEGSFHTHPTWFPDGRKRPWKSESAHDKNFAQHTWHKVAGEQKPMYTISTGGIWQLLNGKYKKVMSYKAFRRLCKCYGYW